MAHFSFRRLKFVLYAAIGVFIIKKYRALVKVIKQMNRAKKLALQLPHEPLPTSVGAFDLDLYGHLKRRLPGGFKDVEELPKNALQLFKIGHEKFKDEGIILVWAANFKLLPFPPGIIVVNSMEMAREILSTKMLPFFVKGWSYEISSDLIGESVLKTSHAEWHKQRVIIDKGFTQPLIEKQFPMIIDTAKDLVERLEYLYELQVKKEVRKNPVDVTIDINVIEEMLKTTMDVLGRVAFSHEIGSLKAKTSKEAPLFEAFETILDILLRRVTYPWKFMLKNLPFLSENRKFNKAIKTLDNVVLEIIKSRRANDKHQEEPRDLLDILLNSDLEDKLILDNMRTILFAGHDTTAAALTWSFYLLSLNQPVVDKIRKEFEEHNKIFSVETIENSDYLNSVILEVLRLYPSAGFSKKAIKEVQIGKYLIPPGIELLFFPFVLQRDERHYEKPNEFIPERWTEQDTEKINLQAKLAKISRTNAYLPFSLGKRNCVGRKLALLEIRVIVLYVLTHFDVIPATQPDSFQDWPHMGMTAVPKDVHVQFKPRNNIEN